LDLEALTERVTQLLAEPHPHVRDGLRDGLQVQRLSALLQTLWVDASKVRDAGIAPDFGIDLDAMKRKAQFTEASRGLSSCIYCFLRGLKDGVGSRTVLLNSLTLKQLEQLEGAWDLLSLLALRVKKYPNNREYQTEIKSAVRSCRSLWRATFPGLVQSMK
jgi:hypothetical protein